MKSASVILPALAVLGGALIGCSGSAQVPLCATCQHTGAALSLVPCAARDAAPPDVVDDAALRRALDAAAQTLMQTKKATPASELIKQLSRRRCTVAPVGPQARSLTPAQAYAQCRSAVVVVAGLYKCTQCTRWHTGGASGVMIDPSGIFVTNYHVINNTKNKAMVAMTADGKVYSVTEVLAASSADDLAVVRLDSGGKRLSALPVAANPPIGTPVTVISHPLHRYYTLTAGIISRYQKTRREGKTAPLMTITADFGRGSSGAPVLDARGAVVGLVSSTSSLYYPAAKGKTEQLQMVFKQCVPGSSILKLISGK